MSVKQQPLVFDEDVVELPDEAPRHFLFVGLLGDHRLPRAAEVVDESGERQDEGFPEQPRFRTEVAEQQMLGNACGFGDFTCRGAAVVLAGEEVAGGGEQKLSRVRHAADATPEPGLASAASWRKVAGARCSLLEPRSVVDCF